MRLSLRMICSRGARTGRHKGPRAPQSPFWERSLAHMKVAHHAQILVLQIVAMIKKQPGVVFKRLDDINLLAGHDQYCVFQATVDEAVPDRGIAAVILIRQGARNNSELLTMQMDGMRADQDSIRHVPSTCAF
jgi:hypothetical protein